MLSNGAGLFRPQLLREKHSTNLHGLAVVRISLMPALRYVAALLPRQPPVIPDPLGLCYPIRCSLPGVIISRIPSLSPCSSNRSLNPRKHGLVLADIIGDKCQPFSGNLREAPNLRSGSLEAKNGTRLGSGILRTTLAP